MTSAIDPLQQPALQPPPGQSSNLANPTSDLKRIIIATLVACLVPPTITLPLRMYVKTRILKAFQFVDVICLLAFCFFVGLVSLSLSLLDFGEGYHGWDISLAKYQGYLHQANFTEIVYMPAILFTKLTILMQLLQVFVVGTQNFRYFILQTLIWLNILFFTTLMFLEIFQCWPRVKIWDATADGHCINISITFVTTAAINVASDVSILTLPILWVSKLQMRTRKKAGLVVIFGTGIFACVSSIMRVIVSVQNVNSLDVTYTLAPVNLWSVAEVSSGLVLACLPFLPRLLSPFRKQSSNHVYNSSGGYSGTTANSTHPHTLMSTKGGIEMDEIAFATQAEPRLPERCMVSDMSAADVKKQSSRTRLKMEEDQPIEVLDMFQTVPNERLPAPEIRKTVDIRQSSGSSGGLSRGLVFREG